jgi:hypothetical protein
MNIKQAIALVPRPLFYDDVIFRNGDVFDIMKAVGQADKEASQERQLKKLAKMLRGANERLTCQNIWNVVKRNIPYLADKNGYERVRMPNAAIYDAVKGKGCDCKSFSVLISDLCRELGITCDFAYISQKPSKKIHHVYCIATLQNGREVILDAVHYAFDSEPSRTYKKMVKAATLPNTEGVQGLNNNFIF